MFKYKDGNWSGGVVIVLYRMLDALAGRTEPSGLKGTILIDGQRPPKGFKFMTGYVIQVTLTRYSDAKVPDTVSYHIGNITIVRGSKSPKFTIFAMRYNTLMV